MFWLMWMMGCWSPGDPGLQAYERGLAALQGDVDPAAAAAAFEAGCDAGHGASCSWLGVQVQQGRGVDRDPERAMALYEQACEAGYGTGCLNAGNLLALTAPRVDDALARRTGALLHQARQLGEAACAAGDVDACLDTAILLQDLGEPLAADTLLLQGCQQDGQSSCNQMAGQDLYRDGDPLQATAKGLLEEWCSDGDSEACGMLGSWLTTRDPAAGAPLLEQACDGGNPGACTTLWALWVQGRVPAPDPEVERTLVRRGCDMGQGPLCVTLADDPAQAARRTDLLERACWMGTSEGCLLRAIVAGGLGPRPLGAVVMRMDPEPTASLPWYDVACRLSDPRGCAELVVASQPLNLAPQGRLAMLQELCRQGLFNACEAL